jgi:hypothetical protein
MSTYVPILLRQKKLKPKMYVQEKLSYGKATHKVLVKLTPGGILHVNDILSLKKVKISLLFLDRALHYLELKCHSFSGGKPYNYKFKS